ncbi:MAG: cell division protein FtsA [Candidatus Harrisonbacteria bacterium RIFCSPHIGHO2_02_FULL_42_16]|uniref:Cell division protein FtsA n=1 Tax=Candidatus Harrisonbacteria bacterium RIFCSPHIGHO2_02_FULL_42_16 TaxID=1798404 RepID=A0A1G1ZHZ4_9BACT|nr:MAG: cell division protein FtsA [Candidatus Harrisonbacteria bacterium RIFCSPHIGHO2_02_FULL_42_16]
MANNFITGLDIGSQSLKAAVAEVKSDGRTVLVNLFKTPSGGMRKGSVDDLAEMTRSLNIMFGEIKKVSKNALKNLFINANGDVHVQSSRGIVAVSRADNEVYQDDIDRAIQASQAIKLPSNRMVLHAITKEFVVDGIGDIRDPLGMSGNRLEVNSLIIDAFGPSIKNLTKCVEMAGVSVGGLIFSPLADSMASLSKNQKDLGVALVDVGFGTTSLCVYEENKLIHCAVFPVGSGNITNDLAIGLKTSVEAAEAVKLTYGSANLKGASGREQVDLKKIDPDTRSNVSRRFIAEIIEVRLAEIFEFVNNELKIIGKASQLPVGVVLVGGGCKLSGIVDFVKEEMDLPAQIGIPDIASVESPNGEISLQAEDPQFVGALGLLMEGRNRMFGDSGGGGGLKNWLKNAINNLLP